MNPIDPTGGAASAVVRIPLDESAALARPDATAKSASQGDAASAFAGSLEHAIDATNQVQAHADAKARAFAAGANVPVHQVMLQLTEADISMRLLTVVTVKALAAYREIASMQI